MKALVIGYGTRGDSQPFAALAYALQEAGHTSHLAISASSASLAESHGIPFTALSDTMNEGLDDPEVGAAIENGYRGVRAKITALKMVRKAQPEIRRLLDEIAAVPTDGVDVVVHPVNSPLQFLAEKLGVPSVPVGLQPGWAPTSLFPNPLMPVRVPGALNHASYGLSSMVNRVLVAAGGGWRQETLGLPRRPHQTDALRTPDGGRTTLLQAFSGHTLSTQAGTPEQLEFPDWAPVTGYFFLPAAEDWTPPERLQTFLDSGEPPIYIGFGSMAGRDPERIGRIVSEAVRLAGCRAVLNTGWGGISADDLGDRILVIDQAPHDWLFPRMKAICHHGGAGTTAASLASGRPQIVCPFATDQPFWARRMHALGVAPEPLPQRRLSADALTAALRRVMVEEAMERNAAELGERIRAEHGVRKAVELIERIVAHHASTKEVVR